MYRLIELYPSDRRITAPRARFIVARNQGANLSHQSRRIACWYLLRYLLSSTSATTENSWRLSHAESGAPRVTNNRKPSQLEVSMAHSEDWLAAGVSIEAKIGVDIERMKPRANMLAIANFLGWKSDIRDIHDFYLIWTLWEASAKCVEGSVLMARNPGFEKLCAVNTRSQVGDSGHWCGLGDRLGNDLFYSVALRCQQSTPMTYRILEPGAVLPW